MSYLKKEVELLAALFDRVVHMTGDGLLTWRRASPRNLRCTTGVCEFELWLDDTDNGRFSAIRIEGSKKTNLGMLTASSPCELELSLVEAYGAIDDLLLMDEQRHQQQIASFSEVFAHLDELAKQKGNARMAVEPEEDLSAKEDSHDDPEATVDQVFNAGLNEVLEADEAEEEVEEEVEEAPEEEELSSLPLHDDPLTSVEVTPQAPAPPAPRKERPVMLNTPAGRRKKRKFGKQQSRVLDSQDS